jgi:hypothetical protein
VRCEELGAFFDYDDMDAPRTGAAAAERAKNTQYYGTLRVVRLHCF